MNPEFLKEGEAIADFMNPDRIVLGGIDERTRDVLANLYEVFHGVEKLRTDTRTAEMIKYAANALLATLISYANEIGNLSAAVGVDGVDVMKGVHLDKRFSPILASGERVQPGLLSYLAAGCGFGGSCFPKDVNALIAYGRHVGMPMRVLKAVIDVNADQPEKMMEMLYRRFPDLAGVKVAVLGMAFKPGTDDIRESPALPVTRALLDAGAVVSAYDPVAAHEAKKIFGTSVQFHDALRDAIAGAAAILIMTRWNQFQELPALVAQAEDSPLIIDGRRMLDKTSVPDYAGIGLPATLEPVSSAAS
jgi:UDPglucose 6-dehydrogenase/GDP-mannose 6-dehydrogenase